jgi:hypothetical protein
MSPEEVLNLNGDFRHSPLLDSVRRLHALLVAGRIPYVIIGGLAVVRNGAVRTTVDVDVLLRREDWPPARALLDSAFEIGVDRAKDRQNGVDVDFLFSGSEWEMIVPLPDPAVHSEYDELLGANFLSLQGLLELKTAVYLQKKREEGIEEASKDLADVVALIRANSQAIGPELFDSMHPAIRKELRRIEKKTRK